jgi:hypothetical protein
VIEVNKRIRWPQFFAQFFTGNDGTGTFEKDSQNGKGLVLQPDTASMLAKFARFEVGFKYSEAD